MAIDDPRYSTSAPHLPGDDLLAEELARCSDCGRTPLIGEQVYLYESAELVCELCRMLRRDEPMLGAQVTHRLGPQNPYDPASVIRVTRQLRE
jgi:hypothetical protein